MQRSRIRRADLRAASSLCVIGLRLAALAISAPALPTFGATPSVATALCTNLASGASWQITINFANGTVDSNPARISGAQISWHDAKDGGNYTLERKSGELTVIFASSTGGYFIHDRCLLESPVVPPKRSGRSG